ncbi:uncharacterized protein LOC135090814 [Scylla paramamosain]|uniref:uncharacterized protein LOC135090814 n=1 Tax=Scylla paramamosain TaxID=85552 RepID=UPI003083535A
MRLTGRGQVYEEGRQRNLQCILRESRRRCCASDQAGEVNHRNHDCGDGGSNNTGPGVHHPSRRRTQPSPGRLALLPGAPAPRDTPDGHVERFQGLPDVGPAVDATSLPLDHVPLSTSLDRSDFQEEIFDYPLEDAPEHEGMIPAFQEGNSDGEDTPYEIPETFEYPDIPEQTQAPEMREEQQPAPPASQPGFQDVPVADVTPLQEEELQLQAPNNQNQNPNQNQRPENRYPQYSGGDRQQVNTQVPHFASPQYEESQDVVDVVSAPRPSRSPPISSRPRPPQYSQIPYRRTTHPNELPLYSSNDHYDLEAQGSREQYRVAYDYEEDLPGGFQGEELKEEEEEEEEEPDRLSVLLLDSTFQCFQKNNGYYADEELDCEVFHYCQDNVKHSWLCPAGASFHQVHLICMPRSEDNICARSSKFHFVNDFLYKELQAEDGRNKTYADRYYPEGFEYGVAGTGGGDAGGDPGYTDGFGAGNAGGTGSFGAGNGGGGGFSAGNVGTGGFSSPGQPPHRPRRPRPNQQPPPALPGCSLSPAGALPDPAGEATCTTTTTTSFTTTSIITTHVPGSTTTTTTTTGGGGRFV